MKSIRAVAEKIEKIPGPKPVLIQKSSSTLSPELQLSHLTLGYGEKVLLEDVSLTIPFGKKVLIMGESGSGKTTFFECLLGFKLPISGSYSWGGEEKMKDGLLSYCPQEPYLFLGNLEENITLFSSSPDRVKLKQVIEQCALTPLCG